MDSNHPVLSHQQKLANELGNYFDNVFVLTGLNGKFMPKHNVFSRSTDWQEGRNIRNSFVFLFQFMQLIRSKKIDVIYSHMTTYQSLLVAPVAKLLRIPNFLWYAHKSNSVALRLAYLVCSGIITSTKGSFPFKGKKVSEIGQGIDLEMFPFLSNRSVHSYNFVHFGRLDRSKGLIEIIHSLEKKRRIIPSLRLTFIGSPARPESVSYRKEIEDLIQSMGYQNWIEIKDAIPRENIFEELVSNDIFIHNFYGSLDKTLLEAVAIGLDVITINEEFIKQFGNWDNSRDLTLDNELDKFLNLSEEVIISKRIQRRKLLEEFHSFNNWIEKTVEILKTVN